MANPSLQIGNDNWAIKEDNLLGYSTAGTRFVPQPITMTRASAGTRVNPSGLVETVELLGIDEITNGDFTQLPLGTSWGEYSPVYVVFEEGVAILNINSSNGNVGIYQEDVFTSGSTYKIVLSMKATASFDAEILESVGAATVNNIGDVSLTTSYQDFIFYYTATGNNDLFIHRKYGQTAGANQSIYIKDVSVKESTKNDLARVDYTGSTSSLLAEPMRTNLITYSEELNSTTNVTPSNTISPDGTLNGLKLTETIDNSQHYGTSYAASVVSGTIYTVSFYIKKGTYDLVQVYTQSSRISASINIRFSTEATSAGGSDFISGSNFMEDIGDGWYRVGFSATANSTGAVSIYLPIKDLSTYVGDVSQYTEYWGAQIEEGSYATSYIPTSGSTVTRVKDQYTKTGISDKINSTEGTFFLDLALLSDISNYDAQTSIVLSDNTAQNRVLLYASSTSNRFIAQIKSENNTLFNEFINVTDITLFNKIAITWKTNEYKIFWNGNPIFSTTTPTATPIGLNSLYFAAYNSTSNPFYGKVKQLQVFKTALSDPELVTLTS